MPKTITHDPTGPVPEPRAVEVPAGPAPVVLPTIPQDAIEVWERLALYGDETSASQPIALNVPGQWYCRWINTQLDGRWNEVVHRKRFIPVAVRELSDPRALTGFNASPEGYVTRGDRGQEILVRIPQDIWDRIQQGKADRLRAKIHSQSAQKEQLQNAIAAWPKGGPEAAEAVREFKGTILEGTERVERRED